MRVPEILRTAWSGVTGRPILVGPEGVSGDYSPKAVAQILLTGVKGLLGEFGQDRLQELGHQAIAQLETGFVTNRATLLQHLNLGLITLQRDEAEKIRFANLVDLSLEDAKKIIDYTPK